MVTTQVAGETQGSTNLLRNVVLWTLRRFHSHDLVASLGSVYARFSMEREIAEAAKQAALDGEARCAATGKASSALSRAER